MMLGRNGFTLVELLVSLGIFMFIVLVGIVFLSNQIRLGTTENTKVKSVQEGFVSELVLSRDVSMAGLGVPASYNGKFVPLGINNNSGTNGSDELIIRGSIISSGSYDYLKWAYTKSSISDIGGKYRVEVSVMPDDPNIQYPDDIATLFTLKFKPDRKDINYVHPFEVGDKIIFMNSDTKQLLSDNIYTVEEVDENSITFTPPSGKSLDFQIMENKKALVFCVGGMNKDTFSDLISEDNFTGYRLSATSSDKCAPGTVSLVRVYGTSMPVADCVLDFQVRFGLIKSDGNFNWVDDISSYSSDYLQEHLKIVRIYIVNQYGLQDSSYLYPSSQISVGDNTITLNGDQRHYRWHITKLEIPVRIFK